MSEILVDRNESAGACLHADALEIEPFYILSPLVENVVDDHALAAFQRERCLLITALDRVDVHARCMVMPSRF